MGNAQGGQLAVVIFAVMGGLGLYALLMVAILRMCRRHGKKAAGKAAKSVRKVAVISKTLSTDKAREGSPAGSSTPSQSEHELAEVEITIDPSQYSAKKSHDKEPLLSTPSALAQAATPAQEQQPNSGSAQRKAVEWLARQEELDFDSAVKHTPPPTVELSLLHFGKGSNTHEKFSPKEGLAFSPTSAQSEGTPHSGTSIGSGTPNSAMERVRASQQASQQHYLDI